MPSVVLYPTDAELQELQPGAGAGSQPCRGVAVLSSSIGHDVGVEEVLAFARTCKLNLVVIDLAWVTHHWPRAR